MTAIGVFRRYLPLVKAHLWLRDRNYDLLFISLSAVTALFPYVLYLILWQSGFGNTMHNGWQLGKDGEDASRQAVNLIVTLFIGGPHMWATFSRTFLDTTFRSRYKWFLLSSLVIPVVVILLGTNTFGVTFPLLVTAFFGWASVHVLHQIIYITEAYNRKLGNHALATRAVDYAVVLSSLYPLATYRISQGTFQVGPVNVNEVLPAWFTNWSLLFPLALGVFVISFIAFVVKTVIEARRGTVSWPKTLFLGLTVFVAFILPAFPNLDVAFQGLNTWHSFQYLGLVWYANHLKAQHLGYRSSLLKTLFDEENGRKYYLFNMGLTGLSLLVIVAFIIVGPERFGLTLEQVYYMAVLCILLIHYYHDHVLFTKPGDFMPATLG